MTTSGDTSLERFSAYFERAPLGIFVASASGRFTLVNQAGCDLFGYGRDEILALSIPDLLQPEDRAAALAGFEQLKQDGQVSRTHRFMVRTGEAKHLRIDAMRLGEDELVGYFQDVTPQIEALRSLRESEETARALLNTPLSSVMLLATDGTVLDCNDTLASRFGMPADDLKGRNIWSLLPSDIARERMARGAAMVADKRPRRFTDQRDGTWFDNYSYPVLDASGNVVKAAVIAHDITDLKRSEAKLHEALAQLEQANEKLAAALEQSEQMLVAVQSASRTKGEFLAKITHEIRTPMNAILGFTQLLLDSGSLASLERDRLEGIRSASGQLLTIVDDVLSMAKLESGRVEQVPEPTRVAELRDALLSTHGQRAVAKGLELSIEVSPALPPVVVLDGKKLYRVLGNLLENGLKFTTQGKVSLEMSMVRQSSGELALRAVVTDTGPGVSEAEQQRLFTPFTQAGVAAGHGGTGLGLAICRELTRLMGGSIRLWSEPGHGCRLVVEVPFGLPVPDDTRAQFRRTVIEEPSFLAARMASYAPAAPQDDEALIALASLPTDTRQTLRRAAIAARQRVIADVAAGLADKEPRLAQELSRIARGFEYQRLVDRLEEES